jgi:hypothetical protein
VGGLCGLLEIVERREMKVYLLLEMVLLSFGHLGLLGRHWCQGWARTRL